MQTLKTIKKVIAIGALTLGLVIAGCSNGVVNTNPVPNVTPEVPVVELPKSTEPIPVTIVQPAEVEVPLEIINFDELSETFAKMHISQWREDYDLCSSLDLTLVDSDAKVLKDTEIRFDEDSYDIHEELTSLTGAELTVYSHDADNNDVAQLILTDEGLITYSYVFDDTINATLIDEDEPLEINFLGQDLEVVNVESSEFTVRTGHRLTFEEGESKKFIIDGQEILVSVAAISDIDDEALFVLNYGNDSYQKSIDEDDSHDFGEYEIAVSEVVQSEAAEGDDLVEFYFGKDAVQEIGDGDSMELFGEPDEESDAEWLWDLNVVGDQLTSISAIYNQERDAEDEDFTPLYVGESLCLPNNYACLKYADIDSEETIKLNLEVDSENSVNRLELRASEDEAFKNTNSTAEYDRVYFTNGTFYNDEDDSSIGTSIGLWDSGYVLDSTFIIGGLEFGVDFTNGTLNLLEVDGKDISTRDGNAYTCDYILVEDPENNYEDGKLEIVLSEEVPEAHIELTG